MHDITPVAHWTADELTVAALEAKWRKDRVGCATGSRIFDIIAKRKDGKYTVARRDYHEEKVSERLTGIPQDEKTFRSYEMEWGHLHEPTAIAEYSLESPDEVVPLGKVFLRHPRIDRAGCSPDALIGSVDAGGGGLEAKCPKTSKHKDFLRYGDIPEEYIPQVLWCLACNPGREWWDYMSYDPRCPEHMRKRVVRIHRKSHAALIQKLEDEVCAFLDEVERDVRYWQDWRQ